MTDLDRLIPIGEIHYLRLSDPVPAVMGKLRMRSTFCGLSGMPDDRVGDTYEGIIARWRAVENPAHVTCRRCRKLGGLIII